MAVHRYKLLVHSRCFVTAWRHHCTQTKLFTRLCDVSPSACLSVCLLACLKSHTSDPNFNNALYALPVAVARFFPDGNAICYAHPVLWMTSCFYIMEEIVQFAMWQHQSDVWQRCLVEIARWRHRSEVRRLRLHLIWEFGSISTRPQRHTLAWCAKTHEN